jgi:mannose-6-phosphate isomerase-like protein (cupin superfamily)
MREAAMEYEFESFHFPFQKVKTRLPGPGGRPFTELFRFGTIQIELFAPQGVDTQRPHEQDEIYVVASGSGEFVNGPVRHRCSTGDAMFVPAGVVHRFENFSHDFTTWVVFCGPTGGHRP